MTSSRSPIRLLPQVLLAMAIAMSIAPAFETMTIRSLPLAQSSPLWGLLLALIAGLLFRFRHHLFTPTPPHAGTAHRREHTPGLQQTR